MAALLFEGREQEVLQLFIDYILREHPRWKQQRAIEFIEEELKIEGLTAKDIEDRNYTYVSMVRKTIAEGGMSFEKFLVSSPFKDKARRLARRYIAEKGWIPFDSKCDIFGEEGFVLWPRNYVKEARVLFAEGKYL